MRVNVHPILIGDAHDPARWPWVEVPVPEGYGAVLRGKVRPGDRYLHCGEARKVVDGKRSLVWVPIEFPVHELNAPAHCYALVIRPGAAPPRVCERCLLRGRKKARRYCDYCEPLVLSQYRHPA